MLFNSKPTAVLYMRRQDAILIMPGKSVRFDIPTELVLNLEVRDANKLAELTASFLESHDCRNQKVLLVLDDSMIFYKSTPLTATDALKDFNAKLPFTPEKRQVMVVAQKDKVDLYGVNKILYQSVAQGIVKTNRLKAVVPAMVYGVHESKKIDRHAISAFFNEGAPLKQADLLAKP